MLSRTEVALTRHCVDRFHERFRPALDRIHARRELEQLIVQGEISGEPPEWMANTMAQEAEAYLIVTEDLVIPLAFDVHDCDLVAKTCIARGHISEIARRRRNERNRRRRVKGRARHRR